MVKEVFRYRADIAANIVSLFISISRTEPQLLRYVRTAIGAGRITNKRAARIIHTPSVTYAIDNRQALALLQQITPYLRTYKVQRAELILNDYVRLTPRNGKYNPAQLCEREAFIERFLRLNPRRHTSS